MTQDSERLDYKEAYEKEHKKNAKLAARIAALEEEKDLLEFKLGRIKNNPLWKHTTGLRKVMHLVLRQTTRVKNCGGLRGIAAKIDYKKREAKAKSNLVLKAFQHLRRGNYRKVPYLKRW